MIIWLNCMVFKVWERRHCIITTKFFLFFCSFYTNSSLISALYYIYKLLFISFVKELWTIQLLLIVPYFIQSTKEKVRVLWTHFPSIILEMHPFQSFKREHKFSQMNKIRCGKGLKSNNHITMQLFMALSAREKYQPCQARKYCTVAILAALILQPSL